MKEKDLENYIVANPSLLEEDLTLIGQQHRVAGKVIDILFESKLGEVVIVEVKQIATRKDIAQLFDYAGYFIESSKNPIRLMMVAFKIPSNFKRAFDYFNIGYAEFPENEITQSPQEFTLQFSEHERSSGLKKSTESQQKYNLTRRVMAQRVKAGQPGQQAIYLLKFLSESDHDLTMNEIIHYMREQKYTGRSYYDLCNALTDVGLISRNKSGRVYTYSLSEV